ncbi:MAG: hypothetical protein EP329_10655 [Deltaproteobacteria bacterium]|nr:MAG: hypothetical protein EP329_10655 [Deltaproteobacteria bacterium]
MADRKNLPALPRMLLGRVRSRLAQLDRSEGGRTARLADQAERILDRLDETTQVLERVARVELALVERLVPIVDDLGQLVKLSLEETRRRVLGHAADATSPRDRRPPPVIDVE